MSSFKLIHQAVSPAMELLLGMGIAQVIATVQVYFSNRRIFAQMTAVADAGFLPVPNQNALPRLLELETAFCGGLLFTLSVGAALSLLSVAAARLWQRCASGRPAAAAVLIAVLTGAVIGLNLRGFDAWTTLYFIAVPPPVFWLAAGSRLAHPTPAYPRWIGLRFLPLGLLALGWFTQYDRGLFIDLRDHLLMSNPVGASISSFYYRYTLYPAEVFKTFDQRLIKTLAVTPTNAIGRQPGLARELIRLDYLPVPVRETAAADVNLRIEDGRLAFLHDGHTVWEDTAERFLADPRRAAADISARTDRFAFFRSVTFYGVLLAFPAALYVLFFALLRLLCGVAAGAGRADAAAAAACLVVGFATLAYFHFARADPLPSEEIAAALASDRWQRRVAGLKLVHEHKIDIAAIRGYAAMLHSPYPQERYWLARALAVSPNAGAPNDLIDLLDDPQINVRTMALEALAQRRDPRAVQPILRLLKTSDEWYDQLYAYQALRVLRWDQTRLH